MKKIAITGATSMLGVALVEEAIENSIEVAAIVRPCSTNLDRLPSSPLVKIIECDLKSLNTLEIDSSDYDVFYHFGWDYTYREKRDDAECQEKNIEYTLKAVRLAYKMGCKLFVGAGSQAEYGRSTDKLSSDSPIRPDIAYGVAKYAAGKLSELLCRDLNIGHIWTRVFSIYGPNDNEATMISYAIKTFLSGEEPAFTKSEQQWDYLYSKDAANAFIKIGQKGKPGRVYCIGSGETHALADYIKMIRNQIDPMLPIGIGKNPYAENQVMYLCADTKLLEEDTGFRPEFTFKKGIEDTIKWYKKRKTQ